MNVQRKKLALALVCGAGAAVLTAAPAVGQTPTQQTAPPIKVEVTGSNIKRVEGEGALPVQVITRDDINRSGATTPMELLDHIAVNNSGGNVNLGQIIGAATFSNQTASLRGLGGSSTLVLVNGKRLGTFAGGVSGAEGVNLSAIPLSAIERVEVLRDGASAIYGSDAIGGVINFIMRQDFSGADVTVWYGTPTRKGGGDQYNASATVGQGDLLKDRYNVFLSASYQEQKSLDQRDRDFSKTNFIPSGASPVGTTSGQTFPAFLYDPTTGAGIGDPAFPNCAPSHISFGGRCRYDPAQTPGVESIPDTKQLNLFGTARYQLNRDWQAYATGLYSRQETEFIIQSTPLSDQIVTTATASGNSEIIIQPTSPFYPHTFAQENGVDGMPLGARYRCVVCGNRDNKDTNEAWQVVTGAKGTMWDWDFDGSFNYSENTNSEKPVSGFYLYTQIVPFLNTGVVNLLGPNTQQALDQVHALQYTQEAFGAKLRGYGVDAKGTGEIYQLPAGPLALALGVHAFKETLTQNPSAALQIGDLIGYGGNFQIIDHSRTNWAAFGELNVPIVKTVEGDVAVRYDHYSDFGSTTNPKVSLRWQPTRSFLARASWGTGFLAPTLYQLFNPQTPGLSAPGLNDPLRCPDPTQANNPDCGTQYTATFGGNPTLRPEKSNQTVVGAIWEPVNGFSLGADRFDIDLKDLVTNGVPIATILDPNLINTYSGLITRAATCAPSAFVPGAPCPITAINQTFVNLGRTKIQGYDVDVRWASPVTRAGRFKIAVTGEYYSKYDTQQPDGSFAGFVSNAFQAVNTGITPRWKSYGALTWDYGPWSAALANTYQSEYVDVNPDVNGNLRHVGSMSLWDVQASYKGFRNLTLTLGAKNVFDTNPPFTNSNLTFQSGYDPSYYDARARVIYGSIEYTFH
ncbi:MAG: TonB-dependent receptor plug domain-containing protein [Casimicrobiaceae bacterium]